MNLTQVKQAGVPYKRKKRVGRGPGSGHGKTSTRGHNGQRSRSGHGIRLLFEGGQTPLYRRIPKRGFNNPFKKEYAIVNVGWLDRFDPGTVVDVAKLKEAGMVKGGSGRVKVLATGQLTKALTVKAEKFSASARQKILAAGGTVEEL
jgi:large subunit ribosomal protein L15